MKWHVFMTHQRCILFYCTCANSINRWWFLQEAAGGSFVCRCASGFVGARCEWNALTSGCDNHACLNGADCHPVISSRSADDNSWATALYRCTCRPGFTGQHCETGVDDCRHNPCRNGLSNIFVCLTVCRQWTANWTAFIHRIKAYDM